MNTGRTTGTSGATGAAGASGTAGTVAFNQGCAGCSSGGGAAIWNRRGRFPPDYSIEFADCVGWAGAENVGLYLLEPLVGPRGR